MYLTKWYYSTWFVALLFALWFLIIPLFFGIFLISKQKKEITGFLQRWQTNKQQEFDKLKEELFGDMENRKNHLQKEIEQSENEVLIKQKEFRNEVFKQQKYLARRELISNLEFCATKKQFRPLMVQEEEEYRDIKYQHQIELENEVNIKRKEIALLSLVSKLKMITTQKEIQRLKEQEEKVIEEIKHRHQEEFIEIEHKTFIKKQEIDKCNRIIHRKYHQLNRLKQLQDNYIKELVVLKDEILYQSFGFYDLRYDLEDSQEYKEMLEKVRLAQKEAVKNNLAVNYNVNWQLNNSYRKGEAWNKRNIKMIIRSFNNECDAIIHKVKFNNVEASEKKIRKAREQLNKLNNYNLIEITVHYLDLKLEELFLAYEYSKKKFDEREEQRHRNELLREELRAQKEIEERLKVLLKEQQHFQNALDSYLNQLENANESLSNDIKREVQKIETELKKIEDERSELDYRVRNAKAGFVYVISNLGAFGENVFKIGMTRRLEPLERIRELSGASVPFPYDVHAMIFAEDAPALENELHKAFNEKRVNKVNNRKEFFRVSLKEIEKVVRENYNKPVEFTRLGIAQEYRETMMIEIRESKKLTSNLLSS
jgi:hypothetical protein